jgi:hypothetical protein
MSSHLDKQALIDAMLKKMRQQLEEKLPDDNATLDQIEDAVEEIGSELQRELQQKIADQRAKKPRDNRLACPCGGAALYKASQRRRVLTRHGQLCWRRPWYYCGACKQGFAPLDNALGLDASPTTRTLREWSAHLAAQLSFEQSVTTLKTLTGVTLGETTLEKIATKVGETLKKEQSTQATLHRKGHLPDQKTACPKRLYVSVDGVFVPLRDPWKKDGSVGDLPLRYAECKVGVVYETNKDKDDKDSRVAWQDYVASFQDAATFTPLVGLLAHKNGQHAAKEVVFLSDGATWIKHLAGREFPSAVHIVDFFHACQHLSRVAEARFGKDTPEGHAWQEVRQNELKTGQFSAVLKEILGWRPSNEAKRKVRREEYQYFRKNAPRMQYQTYLARGYHIGSGVVEATCKRLVAQRLDQAGMHWRQETAEAIVTLRAAQLSTHAPDLRPYCAMPN